LECPHEFVEFANADGVSGRCEITGRAQFHRRIYDWLDSVLNRPATDESSTVQG
jgi:hypothetical protein